MTQTLTTETIKQWRSDAENIARRSCVYETEYSAAEAILALTAELLANREAQPVLYASEETLAYAKEGEKSLVTWSEPMGDAVIPLFTAPPAPAVPGIDELRLTFERTERESDDGFNLHKYGIGYADEATQARWESWLSCRAAMLAQPVSGGYKLPPHLYRELVNSLRDTVVKYQGTQQIREQLSRTLMQNGLSAAAPEGGNG
ncbi:hypothetical protein AM354_21475 [Serratia marcescens]|uniref:hypothetical protein n=1 Tax=Serratia marcescens TaxID=615 RepID=UPI000CE65DA2|nr:hypothetical protein [Serratia marcescens]AVE51985.1 hypothetical protein AM354_21475 [Serratia marcescens]